MQKTKFKVIITTWNGQIISTVEADVTDVGLLRKCEAAVRNINWQKDSQTFLSTDICTEPYCDRTFYCHKPTLTCWEVNGLLKLKIKPSSKVQNLVYKIPTYSARNRHWIQLRHRRKFLILSINVFRSVSWTRLKQPLADAQCTYKNIKTCTLGFNLYQGPVLNTPIPPFTKFLSVQFTPFWFWHVTSWHMKERNKKRTRHKNSAKPFRRAFSDDCTSFMR
jgi:hypothetical protein